MPHTMSPEEIRAFLSHGTHTAKLATSGPGGLPHVMPVWSAAGTWAPIEPESSAAEMPCRERCWWRSDRSV
jgi:hypothetical protein